MLIPYTQLSPETLDSLLDDFCTREGVDNTHSSTLAERKEQLMKALKSEQAFITYNHEYVQPCLISRAEVPPDALRAYKELKLSLQEEEGQAVNANAESQPAPQPVNSNTTSSASDCRKETIEEPDLASIVAQRKADLTKPFSLGRTVMTLGLKRLLDLGAVQLEELQTLLSRHASGDFGLISDSDKLMNFDAIPSRGFLLSRYRLADHDLYAVTDAGHGHTTLMLTSEY